MSTTWYVNRFIYSGRHGVTSNTHKTPLDLFLTYSPSSSDPDIAGYAFEFETVDVSKSPDASEGSNADEDEFSFPLFSASSGSSALKAVSLKEEVEELPRAIRPNSYYFALTNVELKQQTKQSAVSFDDVFASMWLPTIDAWPQKVVALNDLNRDFTRLKMKKRPGLRQRRLKNERRKKLEELEKLEKLRNQRALLFNPRRTARPKVSKQTPRKP